MDIPGRIFSDNEAEIKLIMQDLQNELVMGGLVVDLYLNEKDINTFNSQHPRNSYPTSRLTTRFVMPLSLIFIF